MATDVQRINRACGRWMREQRRQQRMTQAELGRIAGYSRQRISDMERGACCMTLTALCAVSRGLGVDVNGALVAIGQAA